MYEHFKTTYDIKYPHGLTKDEQHEIERMIWDEYFDKEKNCHKGFCYGILPDGSKVYMVNFEYKGVKGKFRPSQDFDKMNPDTEEGRAQKIKNLALYISMKKEEQEGLGARYNKFCEINSVKYSKASQESPQPISAT